MTDSEATLLFEAQLVIYRRDNANDLKRIQPPNVNDAQLDALIVMGALEFWKGVLRQKAITTEQAFNILAGVIVGFLSISSAQAAQNDPLAPTTYDAFYSLYLTPTNTAIVLVGATAQLNIDPAHYVTPVIKQLWALYQANKQHPTTASVYGVITSVLAVESLRMDSAKKSDELSEALASNATPQSASDAEQPSFPPTNDWCGIPYADNPPKSGPKVGMIIALVLAAVGILALSYIMLNRR